MATVSLVRSYSQTVKENVQLINRQINPQPKGRAAWVAFSRVDRHLASEYTNRCLHPWKPRQGYQSHRELSVLTHRTDCQKARRRDVGEGNAPALWVKCDMVQPVKKTVWRFLRTLKIAMPYDSVITLLGTHPKHQD